MSDPSREPRSFGTESQVEILSGITSSRLLLELVKSPSVNLIRCFR